MIEYRGLKIEELSEARALCVAKDLDFPSRPECVFGAFENGKLVGICALKKVYQVEPLVNISGSALVSQVLGEKVLACASLVTSEVEVITKNSAELFEKYGFVITDKDMTILHRSV
jgi:N-acetylglutamate synthase-like GNAT family acetyltransferase